ncbi:prolyl oligopeptidase family serine peptidase [uncultured Draconibacterium sp.]|uniref:alpha/beta hydrolase family protein n=1 Tax=uncultured Draconibacterium sp. TaxID=1573823 RepID=UPI0029C7D13D|nr:prolyl oligopeptidase family serine peptidase [uncultured Draconibacterium sp.]
MKRLYPLLLLFLFLLLAAGQELTAQGHSDLKNELSSYFRLLSLKMSENGRWLTAWKAYDQNRDTLLIFDSTEPGKPVEHRIKVKSAAFVGTNLLLTTRLGQAELLELPEFKSTHYAGVKNAQVLENKKQFLLHYNKQEQNKLELRQSDGHLLNVVNRVVRFFVTKENHIYAFAENPDQGYDVFGIMENTIEQVYHTSNKISYLDVAKDRQELIIHEQNQQDSVSNLVFLDIQTKKSYPLNEILTITFQRAFTEEIEDGVHFLKLIVPKKQQQNEMVDIWRGNDKRLVEKFYPPITVMTYIWRPREHFIRKAGTDKQPKALNIRNNRYFLSIDPWKLQDYLSDQPPIQLFLYDLEDDNYVVLDTIAPQYYLSGNGNYALSPVENGWKLYHLPSKGIKFIEGKHLSMPWFSTDCKFIIFQGEGAVWQWDLKTETLTCLAKFDEYITKIANCKRETIKSTYGRFSMRQVNLSNPLLIELYDPETNQTGYSLWHKGKTEIIIPPTSHYISSLTYNQSLNCFSWLEENYNQPSRLVHKKTEENPIVIYQSNKQDENISSLKQEIISYTNSKETPLKGILYYPLEYKPSQKYPMVVHIYEKQNRLANRYPFPSFYESIGFNIRLLLERGYFVYLPDIEITGKNGPGIDALDCVNHALDALAYNPTINKEKTGLIGHSFGGYETDYIATRSDRFATFVSGSGHSDIVWDSHSFNCNFQIPDYVRIEANIYKLGVPFSADKGLYFKNNPAYHAEKVNAPVLLWTGTEDENVTPDHTMAFYNALCRNEKDVIALFYKGEGHSLMQKPAQYDLTCKLLDWFDYFLKDSVECEWISEGMNKKDAQ